MENKEPTSIPEGYMMDSCGRLVPEKNVSDLDKLRNETVIKLMGQAREMAAAIHEFKALAYADVCAFVDIAAEKYNVKLGGKKGNITLLSYDGNFKILLAVDETIGFTEQMSLARTLIFECINKWSEGAEPALVTLVTKAFETDKQGHLSASRILALRGLKIDDSTWKRAMELIGESIQVQSTVHYLRFYERTGENGKFRQIAFDGGII